MDPHKRSPLEKLYVAVERQHAEREARLRPVSTALVAQAFRRYEDGADRKDRSGSRE